MTEKSVMVTATGYFPNIGGVENSLYYLSHAFIGKGYSVDLVASNSILDDNVKVPRFEDVGGVRIFRYNYYFFGRKSLVLGCYNAISVYRSLRKLKSYDVVICRDHVSVVLLRMSGFKNVIYLLPSVIRYQSKLSRFESVAKFKAWKNFCSVSFHDFIQKLALKVARQNAVFSDCMERQVVKGLRYRGELLRTVPGIDCTRFLRLNEPDRYAQRKQFSLKDKDFVLLGLGRFAEVKGFDYAINAMAALPRNFKLFLVGSGPEEVTYNKLIDKLCLQDRVVIFPKTFEAERFYQISDAFVLPSTYEPFGQTLLEAQASGLPVIAFSNAIDYINTETNNIVGPDTSVLAEEFSVPSFSDAILQVYEGMSSGRLCPEKISRYTREKFSWHHTVDDLLSEL